MHNNIDIDQCYELINKKHDEIKQLSQIIKDKEFKRDMDKLHENLKDGQFTNTDEEKIIMGEYGFFYANEYIGIMDKYCTDGFTIKTNSDDWDNLKQIFRYILQSIDEGE